MNHRNSVQVAAIRKSMCHECGKLQYLVLLVRPRSLLLLGMAHKVQMAHLF